MTNDEAAKVLGCKASEVAGTESHAVGSIVVTTAGARLIILDSGEIRLFGRPDGRPVDDPTSPPYAMAVYSEPGHADAGDEVEHVDEPNPVDTGDGPEVEHVTEPAVPKKRPAK